MGFGIELRTAKVFCAAFLLVVMVAPGPACAESALPYDKSGLYHDRVDWEVDGGDGYLIVRARWGNHREFERVAFQFAGDEKTGSESGDDGLPQMELRTEEYPARLVINIKGAEGARKALFESPEPFKKSRFVAGVEVYESCEKGLVLSLTPAKPVSYEVFSLRSPTRLVVDLKPTETSPPDVERYSLRTLPLFGDQMCLFLDALKEKGIDARLLIDGSGRIVGEVMLYETFEEAFVAKEEMKEINERFSLNIRARGMMDIPRDLP